MYSVLAWRAPSKEPLTQRWRLGPIWVQGVWVERTERTPKWLLRRRIKRSVTWLHGQGITQGVYPKDMAVEGIAPVSTVALRQGLATVWLKNHLEKQGILPKEATVGLVAQRITPQVLQTLEQLALTHRQVHLEVADGEQACQRLRRLYGVAVQCNLGLNAFSRCDAVVAFAPMAGLTAQVVTYEEESPLPPLQWPEQWSCPPEVLPIEGWAMVASTEMWQDNWVKLALTTEF